MIKKTAIRLLDYCYLVTNENWSKILSCKTVSQQNPAELNQTEAENWEIHVVIFSSSKTKLI